MVSYRKEEHKIVLLQEYITAKICTWIHMQIKCGFLLLEHCWVSPSVTDFGSACYASINLHIKAQLFLQGIGKEAALPSLLVINHFVLQQKPYSVGFWLATIRKTAGWPFDGKSFSLLSCVWPHWQLHRSTWTTCMSRRVEHMFSST